MSYKECAGGSCGLFLEKLLRRGELLFSEAGEQRHDPLAVCPSQRCSLEQDICWQTAARIPATVVPAMNFVPQETVTSRSVFSRNVAQGTPRQWPLPGLRRSRSILSWHFSSSKQIRRNPGDQSSRCPRQARAVCWRSPRALPKLHALKPVGKAKTLNALLRPWVRGKDDRKLNRQFRQSIQDLEQPIAGTHIRRPLEGEQANLRTGSDSPASFWRTRKPGASKILD
jgi:hypothetical protein